jgi:hypothetical protein
LSTSRKSPTRRAGSIDAEGMRNGCTRNVVRKRATTTISSMDLTALRRPP